MSPYEQSMIVRASTATIGRLKDGTYRDPLRPLDHAAPPGPPPKQVTPLHRRVRILKGSVVKNAATGERYKVGAEILMDAKCAAALAGPIFRTVEILE